ncbi:MAG: efflux RND transporter periplasmic adaptor subunit [bacterium]|nr:efflux RND transporter periplasmic adaptor subunit [bacterium]
MRLIIKMAIFLTVINFLAGCKNTDSNGRIYGSGIIETNEIDISSKVIGRISFLPWQEGQQITAGQVIARLDDLEKAEKDYARAKKLFADNIIPADQFEQVQKFKDNYIIISPASGTVIIQELFPGEIVTPGLPIITIANTDDLWVKIYIPEKDIGKVRLGAPADVLVDSFPKDIFSGVVTNISIKAEFIPKNIQTKEERVNQVFAVKIKVTNKEQRLKIGMPADVYIKE